MYLSNTAQTSLFMLLTNQSVHMLTIQVQEKEGSLLFFESNMCCLVKSLDILLHTGFEMILNVF